jgi:hypothetical protein
MQSKSAGEAETGLGVGQEGEQGERHATVDEEPACGGRTFECCESAESELEVQD